MHTKPLIMIVEDNKQTQETLKRDLEYLGMEVWQSFSAEDAWAALEAADKIPHVLILDFHLPGEDGPGFYRRLAVSPRFREIPVIPFTALIGQQDATSSLTLASYISSRDASAPHTQPIVSKKGREDIYKTPSELVLAIGHALRQQSFALSDEMRKTMKDIVSSLVDELDASNGVG